MASAFLSDSVGMKSRIFAIFGGPIWALDGHREGDGAERSIPTLASNLNRVCGKDLDIFHTRVPAEVPAKYYPGSF